MTKFHILLFLTILKNSYSATIRVNEEIKNASSIETLNQWIKERIQNPVKENCFGKVDKFEAEDLLVKYVDCQDEGAIKNYSFTGKNKTLDGNGTLILITKEKQEKCIKVRDNIVGITLLPDFIEGESFCTLDTYFIIFHAI